MTTGSAIAYTVGGTPTTSSTAATSAPAVVPTNAGRSVERVSAAEVRRSGEHGEQHPEAVRQVEHPGEQPGHRERQRQPQRALEVDRARREVLAQPVPPQPGVLR